MILLKWCTLGLSGKKGRSASGSVMNMLEEIILLLKKNSLMKDKRNGKAQREHTYETPKGMPHQASFGLQGQ